MKSKQNSAGSKRPRLSLEIKTSCSRSSRAFKGRGFDAPDLNAFNTLSNAYATAIEKSCPLPSEPVTAINTLQAFSLETPSESSFNKPRVATPYAIMYPETPLTATSASPSRLEMMHLPSTMTATPPLSAETTDSTSSSMFIFSSSDISSAHGYVMHACSATDPFGPRRRLAQHMPSGLGLRPPYSHPRSLHSILRNSPLPPRTAIPSASPRRQSLRLQEKAAKKVGYNSPLTQEIINNKYTKSHMELFGEDVSPYSPSFPVNATGYIARNGSNRSNGLTEGQGMVCEAAVRRAGVVMSVEPEGTRKRKRPARKCRWVWTIGVDDDEEEARSGATLPGTVEIDGTPCGDSLTPDASSYTFPDTPTASIEATSSVVGSVDGTMSDGCSVVSTEDSRSQLELTGEGEADLATPTAPARREPSVARKQDTPIPELWCDKRETPVPPVLR